MTLSYRFRDVDRDGVTIRAQAASSETEHRAIVRDVLAAGDLWGGAGSGQRPRTKAANRRQHMASTDSAVGSSWA
jgi:hypothetical protein